MDMFAILATVLSPKILGTIFLCTLYGSFVGAMPGLTATMAVALLVPFTWFMDPVQAAAAIVATTTTAIFAGDISGAILKIPGTPASAAYVEDSYRLSQSGKSRSTLFAALFASVCGGVIGVLILALATPLLANLSRSFSSDEVFWLATLGLSCAVLVGGPSVPRNFASLLIGLAIATIGIDVAVGHPRFTFGNLELYDGVSFIPAMIGMFALSELLRNAALGHQTKLVKLTVEPLGEALATATRRFGQLWKNVLRSASGGTVIGALPGAGADVAAWIAYAVSRRFSRNPEAYGKGHLEGIVDGGAANNAAVAGAWTPALVFGIPGDSVTAIAIGVLMMKGLTPGPDIFNSDATLVYTIFGAFLMANILMLFAGGLVVTLATQVLRVPRAILMPLILLLAMIGGFAITGSTLAIWIILALGLLASAMLWAKIPLAPAILGIVLGRIVEDNFMVSMMKARGDLTQFFARDTAAVLGALTLIIWALLLYRALRSFLDATTPHK
ncbi:tripartite tricarboxylate transporter permease [Roseinatronobacter alkalisoli]|uniref:Tripartite tricarboxylate transporter permease n=1 Tax=Roseinatronobacter alkalisoli TaxID=3028235 RepID=A0ABT5TC53_9RHOB|nr:tripartite tricarboxylate transporter permease [Roseinatronobacter sp. HJB301]MDD7972701.1 tripartite tricarboxylate transporter permease [Roseinatronobacter sp. HJB301]